MTLIMINTSKHHHIIGLPDFKKVKKVGTFFLTTFPSNSLVSRKWVTSSTEQKVRAYSL
jgi:hypothetical protein